MEGLFTAVKVSGAKPRPPFCTFEKNSALSGWERKSPASKALTTGRCQFHGTLLEQHYALAPSDSPSTSALSTQFSAAVSLGYCIFPLQFRTLCHCSIRGDCVALALLHHAFTIHLAQCQRQLENSQNPGIRQHVTLSFLICT